MMSRLSPMLSLLFSLWLTVVAGQTDLSHLYGTAEEEPLKTTYGCEGRTLTVECPQGFVIRIQRANYGRLSLHPCSDDGDPEGWELDCLSTKALPTVMELCEGYPMCAVPVLVGYFGDPCPNTSKYLELEYSCEMEVEPTERPTRPPRPSPTTTTTTSTTTTPTTTASTTTSTTRSTTTSPRVTTTTTPWRFMSTEDGFVHIDTTSLPPATVPPMAQFCEETVHRDIVWPRTLAGYEASMPCPNNAKYMATWQCADNPVMWLGTPNLRHCVSPEVKEFEEMLSDGTPMTEVAGEMSLASEHVAYGGDLETLASTMKDLVTELDKEIEYLPAQELEETVGTVNREVITTSSNLLSESQEPSWQDLPQAVQADTALDIVNTVEDSAFQVAKVINTPLATPIIHVEVNIVMEINIVATDGEVQVKDVVFPDKERITDDKWSKSTDSICISGNTIKQYGKDGLAKLIFLTFDNLGQFLAAQSDEPSPNTLTFEEAPEEYIRTEPPKKATEPTLAENMIGDGIVPPDADMIWPEIEVKDDLGMETKEEKPVKIVNSNIISASINNKTGVTHLEEPITYTLAHKTTDNVFNPSCSFWDYSGRIQDGEWSSFGCKVKDTNLTHTVCECDHLTNFAVLMDVVGVKLSEPHSLALTYLTYTGCIISLICLFLCWLTFTFCKNLQCDRNTIHKHLVFNLFVAELIFLVGIAQYQHEVLCSVIAGFLHYFFLVAFAWMCLEGIQLYVMLVQVFEPEKSRRCYYYLSAYGIPALIVAISAGIHPQGYGTASYCWLNVSTGAIWAFVGPVVGVITVNIVMLSIAIYVMCKHANMAAKLKMKEHSQVEKIRGSASLDSKLASSEYSSQEEEGYSVNYGLWVKGALVLVVLLGLTWAIGLLYVSQHSIVMAYMFTLFNSLQGLFIFLFHCLMDERVQKEYKHKVRGTPWLPECIRVSYGGAPASTYSSPNTSSSAGNYFQKLWSSRRRKRLSTSTIIPRSSSSTPASKSGQFQNFRFSNGSSSGAPAVANDALLESGCGPAEDDLGYLEPITVRMLPQDTGGIQGDLSMVEGSVVDTEGLTEYCQNGGLALDVDKYIIGGGQSPPRDSAVKEDSDEDSLPEKEDIMTLPRSERDLDSSDDDTLKLKKRPPSYSSQSSNESLPGVNDLNKQVAEGPGAGCDLNIRPGEGDQRSPQRSPSRTPSRTPSRGHGDMSSSTEDNGPPGYYQSIA